MLLVSRDSAVLVVLAVIAYYLHGFLAHNGAFKIVNQIGHEQCQRIAGPHGMEDITITAAGQAIITNDNREWFHGAIWDNLSKLGPADQSDLYVFDLNVALSERRLRKLTIHNIPASEPHRHYHGIGLRQHTTAAGVAEDHLYVVTHTLKGEAVFILRINYKQTTSAATAEVASSTKTTTIPESLTLVGIIRDPLYPDNSSPERSFKALNDVAGLPVAATGNNSNRHVLFISNWVGVGQDSRLAEFETLATRAWAYVIQCDATAPATTTATAESIYQWQYKCHRAIEGLKSGNGIDISHDNKYVIVAESGGKAIKFFPLTITAATAAAPAVVTVAPEFSMLRQTTSHLDNVWVDRVSGHLWSGAHPAGLRYVGHRDSSINSSTGDHTVFAPSEAIRVKYIQSSKTYSELAESVVVTDNSDVTKHLSGSASAVYWNGEVILGAVFDKGLLVCPQESRQ